MEDISCRRQGFAICDAYVCIARQQRIGKQFAVCRAHKLKTLVMYNLQDPKLPRLFELLLGSVRAAFGFMKPKSRARAAVELDEQGQVVESKTNPETSVSPLKIQRTQFLREVHSSSVTVVTLISSFHAREVLYP